MDNNSFSSINKNPFPNIISKKKIIFRYLQSFVVAASASPLPHFVSSQHKNSYLTKTINPFFVLVQHHLLDFLKKWICKCIFFSLSFIKHHCYFTISIIFVSFFCHYVLLLDFFFVVFFYNKLYNFVHSLIFKNITIYQS